MDGQWVDDRKVKPREDGRKCAQRKRQEKHRHVKLIIVAFRSVLEKDQEKDIEKNVFALIKLLCVLLHL